MGYSFDSRIRYSEIGENGCLTLPGILNYFQDCCTFHSESIGQGMEAVNKRERVWVLSANWGKRMPDTSGNPELFSGLLHLSF